MQLRPWSIVPLASCSPSSNRISTFQLSRKSSVHIHPLTGTTSTQVRSRSSMPPLAGLFLSFTFIGVLYSVLGVFVSQDMARKEAQKQDMRRAREQRQREQRSTQDPGGSGSSSA